MNGLYKIFIISLNRTKRKHFNSNGERQRVHLTDACQRKEMREFHWLSKIVRLILLDSLNENFAAFFVRTTVFAVETNGKED